MKERPRSDLPSILPQEMQRYARHVVLPELGREGQQKLKAGRVLVVGLGGLGSPATLYLAAAGVGKLGLLDNDTVAISNLQRQILFGEKQLGSDKTQAAWERLRDLNSHVHLEVHRVRLQADNALSLMKDYDVIVDGTDNFPSRYLLNDACVRLGKPNVYGAVNAFEGQLSVFWSPRGPCLRCLFPEPPPPNLVPTCAEAGVVGAVPGIIGSFQALEVVKILTGAGDSLIGRFLALDGLRLRMREIKIARNPQCPVCSGASRQGDLEDLSPACTATSTVHEPITPEELQAWKSEGRPFTLLDIRLEHEATLPDAVSIPAEDLAERLHELSSEHSIIVCCRRGFRSLAAADTLRAHGFRHVLVLKGGVEALQ